MVSHAAAGTLETTVKILTWNLWWRFGPWEARIPAIIATLKQIDADIICLQEVWDDGARNFAAELAAELGFNHAYAPGAKPNNVVMGNAILSRWPISQQDITALFEPKGEEESRVVLFTEIDGPRGKIPVFTTHLHWQFHHSHIRQQQVVDLTQFIDSKRPWKFPPVLCGDFNADPQAEEIRMLTGQTTCPTKNLVFHDAWGFAHPHDSGFTWDNKNPYVALDFEQDRRIDYVFAGFPRARGAGHVVACDVVGIAPKEGVQPSDHYGVLAMLRY